MPEAVHQIKANRLGRFIDQRDRPHPPQLVSRGPPIPKGKLGSMQMFFEDNLVTWEVLVQVA